MSMNKNQIVMASIGGVALVATLALGFLAYSSWSDGADAASELEDLKANVKRIANAAVAPEQKSVNAIEANAKTLVDWYAENFDAVKVGDIAPEPNLTKDALKARMVDEARAIAEYPGSADGKFVRAGFEFGFKDIIAGGAMPEADAVAAMTREWADVRFLATTLAEAGALELAEVTREGAKSLEPPPELDAKGRPKKKKKTEEVKPLASVYAYTLVFQARPVAFVKALNALSTAKRFTVVDSLTCRRVEDALASAVADRKDASAAAPAGGRRGRRGRRAADENTEEAEAQKKGLVVDPQTDVPFTVTMKVSTYDFGTAVEAAAAPETAEQTEEAQK